MKMMSSAEWRHLQKLTHVDIFYSRRCRPRFLFFLLRIKESQFLFPIFWILKQRERDKRTIQCLRKYLWKGPPSTAAVRRFIKNLSCRHSCTPVRPMVTMVDQQTIQTKENWKNVFLFFLWISKKLVTIEIYEFQLF